MQIGHKKTKTKNWQWGMMLEGCFCNGCVETAVAQTRRRGVEGNSGTFPSLLVFPVGKGGSRLLHEQVRQALRSAAPLVHPSLKTAQSW